MKMTNCIGLTKNKQKQDIYRTYKFFKGSTFQIPKKTMFQSAKITSLYLFLLILILSCQKENAFDCIKPVGKIIEETRTVPAFHTIVVQDKIDVYLKQEGFQVRVKAGQYLIDNVRTEVVNETLYIRNKNKCNFIRDPKKKTEIYVNLPKLKYLKHTGSGNIYTVNTFIQDTMIIRMETPGDVHLQVQTHYIGGSTHGNGDLYLSGNTDYFYYHYNGTNFIYATPLSIRYYAYIESHSVGHAYLNLSANSGMDAALFSYGNIYYTGSPSYLKYISKSKGTVIKQSG